MPQSSDQRSQPPEDSQSSVSTGQKPADKFHDGPVHVSIWENEGAKGRFRTASFELRYKDRHQEWQTGRSYAASDLKHLESAARDARARIESWRHALPAKPSQA